MLENEWDIRITTDTPYLTLMGELWDVYCEGLEENWPHYNNNALFSVGFIVYKSTQIQFLNTSKLKAPSDSLFDLSKTRNVYFQLSKPDIWYIKFLHVWSL